MRHLYDHMYVLSTLILVVLLQDVEAMRLVDDALLDEQGDFSKKAENGQAWVAQMKSLLHEIQDTSAPSSPPVLLSKTGRLAAPAARDFGGRLGLEASRARSLPIAAGRSAALADDAALEDGVEDRLSKELRGLLQEDTAASPRSLSRSGAASSEAADESGGRLLDDLGGDLEATTGAAPEDLKALRTSLALSPTLPRARSLEGSRGLDLLLQQQEAKGSRKPSGEEDSTDDLVEKLSKMLDKSGDKQPRQLSGGASRKAAMAAVSDEVGGEDAKLEKLEAQLSSLTRSSASSASASTADPELPEEAGGGDLDAKGASPALSSLLLAPKAKKARSASHSPPLGKDDEAEAAADREEGRPSALAGMVEVLEEDPVFKHEVEDLAKTIATRVMKRSAELLQEQQLH
eukprot:TRINITY_DN13498_c0_g1_i1.p1 TRINITY_DN13498_c0_g1~~TRINITY_DN13498_c0_g1_i1.p1  ORF type:complete len:404 (+),score=131.27 TRINITY_DN13498_c0_g1_i1:111-1322(+)